MPTQHTLYAHIPAARAQYPKGGCDVLKGCPRKGRTDGKMLLLCVVYGNLHSVKLVNCRVHEVPDRLTDFERVGSKIIAVERASRLDGEISRVSHSIDQTFYGSGEFTPLVGNRFSANHKSTISPICCRTITVLCPATCLQSP